MPAASPSALDACVTTPSSEVAHRIGGSSAASCPPRSGGNIRDPPPGVRPCAKSPTDSLGLTEPKSHLPMPPHGPTPIPARPVPAVQACKESRPLVLDKDGSQHLEPPKAKSREPSEPSSTRDPSAPALACASARIRSLHPNPRGTSVRRWERSHMQPPMRIHSAPAKAVHEMVHNFEHKALRSFDSQELVRRPRQA